MVRCELCGKTIAGQHYLIGIKEIPSKDDSHLSIIYKKLSPKKQYYSPCCRSCADEALDKIEAMQQ